MSIYQHFRPEEKDFIDQVLNWKTQVEHTYAAKLTDFLDPREQEILKTIIGKNNEVQWELFGGFPNAERKRALLYPDYFHWEEADFQVILYEVEYPSKFVTIEHPQVLGSLMSLGLKRGKFGDILMSGDRVQFFSAAEIDGFISMQLDSIGRTNIKLKQAELTEAVDSAEGLREISVTCSSLRLDAIISAFYNISRQKSLDYINHKLVKVNWTQIENAAFECRTGDLISVRGLGRAKVMSIEGKTKKDKWRLTAGKNN